MSLKYNSMINDYTLNWINAKNWDLKYIKITLLNI